MPETNHHRWPSEPTQHVWGPWFLESARQGTKPPVQYRTCIHPTCTETEHREVSG